MSAPLQLHPTLAALRAHFPPEAISWRAGPTQKDPVTKLPKRTKPLAYIDARDVQDRLDTVLGLGWSSEYIPMQNGTTCCKITITVDGVSVWRSDGAEMIPDGQKPEQQEMAHKGSYSDAFKRAAVKFGVGQYLYNVDAPWVDCDERGNIKESEMGKLNNLLRRMMGMQPVALKPAMLDVPDNLDDPLADKPGTPSPDVSIKPTHAPNVSAKTENVDTSPVDGQGKPILHNISTGEVRSDPDNPDSWREEIAAILPEENYPDKGEVLFDNAADAVMPVPPAITAEGSGAARTLILFALSMLKPVTEDMAAYKAETDRLFAEMLPADIAIVKEKQEEWKALQAQVAAATKLKASQGANRNRGKGRSQQTGAAA